ncbi:MAG: ATP-binding cassette domain-containing protein, partial [Myxococcales bacterium]|nr:ATP-binding cassette domain-containing protein [Myxococcales bacterium]
HANVDELVGNLDLFRTFGAGDQVLQAMERAGVRAGAEAARVEAVRAGLSGANEVLGALAVLGAVMLAQRFGLGLGDGALLAFAAVFFMAYRPLRDLGDGRGALLKGQAALESLGGLVGPGVLSGAAFSWGNEELVCRGFGHAERGPRIGLRLGYGELCWLRGENGSGKTTLLRCLLGLEPAAGEIAYGGRPLAEALVGPGSRPFAWVPQDAPMVTGSLLDNVRLMGAGVAQANGALELLGAEWLVQRLGDAKLGPGGRNVSGGERRLIALARAVATDQPVLLLDEPLVGVDAEGRERITSALARVRGARSLIVVSHEALPADLVDHEMHLSPQSPKSGGDQDETYGGRDSRAES